MKTQTAWPRWVTIAAGAWLFVSSWIWAHGAASRTNTWVLGLAIFLAAIGMLILPALRWVNTTLAMWLFLSTLVIHHASTETLWNNLIVAVVVFVVSFVPSAPAGDVLPGRSVSA